MWPLQVRLEFIEINQLETRPRCVDPCGLCDVCFCLSLTQQDHGPNGECPQESSVLRMETRYRAWDLRSWVRGEGARGQQPCTPGRRLVALSQAGEGHMHPWCRPGDSQPSPPSRSVSNVRFLNPVSLCEMTSNQNATFKSQFQGSVRRQADTVDLGPFSEQLR